MPQISLKNVKVAVIGLGYVGLPLAVEFGKKLEVIGYDISTLRVDELKTGLDRTREVETEELDAATRLSFTADLSVIASCNVFIITVPTPIDESKRPDLRQLLTATEMVGNLLKVGDVVIYESTVYPGCTEEDCIPILEEISGLKLNESFFCGYSPERINPGDKSHRLMNVKKVVSGSTPATADWIKSLYELIISAGTYTAKSIQVAEAAKIIENTQRDLNIALMNELAIIFNRMGLNTNDVLSAASTKWNFLPFHPGLVGGHCIGVDPYYLTYKAMKFGYHPEIILAGRRLNESMPSYIVSRLLKLLSEAGIKIFGARVLVMGYTFKPNCPDARNTKVNDLCNELAELNFEIDILDPVLDRGGINLTKHAKFIDKPKQNYYDVIMIAVGHLEFKRFNAKKIQKLGKKNHIIFDIPGMLPAEDSDAKL